MPSKMVHPSKLTVTKSESPGATVPPLLEKVTKALSDAIVYIRLLAPVLYIVTGMSVESQHPVNTRLNESGEFVITGAPRPTPVKHTTVSLALLVSTSVSTYTPMIKE